MNKFYRYIIVSLILSSFLFHDAVWAFSGRVKEDTLGPVSVFLEEVSCLCMEMAGVARGILAGIEKHSNSHPSSPIFSAGDLYIKLLQRDEYKIESDLKKQGVHIVYRKIKGHSDLPDRIEFIGQRFTIAVTDSEVALFLPKGIAQVTIPGTSMVMALNERIEVPLGDAGIGKHISDIKNAFRERFIRTFKGEDKYLQFMQMLVERYGLSPRDSDEDCLMRFFREIISTSGPIKFPTSFFTYPNGILGFEVVAYLLYETEIRGVISEKELFMNLGKYSDFVIQMEHSAFSRRPPLRREFQTIDIRYSYYPDGIGDLNRSVTVARMLRRKYPDVRIRFYYLAEHEEDIKIFFPQYRKGENTVIEGIEIIQEDEIKQDGDIAFFSDTHRLTDQDNHSPVQIVVSEYGVEARIVKRDFNAPSITDVVDTGPGMALFLNSEVERLKQWYDSLSDDERRKERVKFFKRLVTAYTSYGSISDAQAEQVARYPWTFAYTFDDLESTFWGSGFHPFLEVYREVGMPTPFFMFIAGKELDVDESIKDLSLISKGLNVISLNSLAQEDFVRLMLFCDLPYIVTGSCSLTEAMQIGKPFVYEVRAHKMGIEEELPFYFFCERTQNAHKNPKLKRAFKRFINRCYPNFPKWDFSLPSVEEKIVEAVEISWGQHLARIDSLRFRRLYDDIVLRLLGSVVPEAFERYLPREDGFWADVAGAERKGVAEFLETSPQIYTIEDVKLNLSNENIEPGTHFVIKASDREIAELIRSVPGLELPVRDAPKGKRTLERIERYRGRDWKKSDLCAELVIYRIKGTDFWIVIKGEVDVVRANDEKINNLAREGLLGNFVHSHPLVKGRRMAYIPSARDVVNSFLYNATICMVAEEGVLLLDFSGLKNQEGNFWIPTVFDLEFEKLWNLLREKMVASGELDFNAFKALGVETKFFPMDRVDEDIFTPSLGIKELLESSNPAHQIIGLEQLFSLLGENAAEFIGDYIREKDDYFKNMVFKRLIGKSVNIPIIKLLSLLLNDPSLVIRLRALRILFGVDIIDESTAREIIRGILKAEGLDKVKKLIKDVGDGRWLRSLFEEMGEKSPVETLCSGRIISSVPGWSPFIVKSGIPCPEVKIDDENIVVLLDGDEVFRMSLSEWELVKEGVNPPQINAWINAINKVMIGRVLEYVDKPDNYIELVYDESGVRLNISVEKELLIALFDGRDDMDMAVAEFLGRLSSALQMEMMNGVDISKLQGEKPIRFMLVDGFSHLGGDGVKNRAVILHRVLQELRRQDKDVFDSYVEMLIAHELGLHEARGIKSEDTSEEEKRIDIDVNNFFRALLRRQKNYKDVEGILDPIIGVDNEFLFRLRDRFSSVGVYLPAEVEDVSEKKIGDLFKEVVMRNLGGIEIINLFLEGDTYFSNIRDSLQTNMEEEPERFLSLERAGNLDNYIFRLAKFYNLIGLPAEDELVRLFPNYPNLARSLGRIYRETLPSEWKDKYGLEMELVTAHVCRVARLALLIARNMRNGISSEDEKIIALAALLHDMGKGKVIDIISSPRKLTQAEFEKVNQHADESITQLDSFLDRMLKTEAYKKGDKVRLPKEVLKILQANTDFRKAIRYHHTVGKIAPDSEGKSRLIAEILMAADVLDALLDASRPYILQGGDVKSVGDALDILTFMKDRATGKPLIRDEIRTTLKELDVAKDTAFVDVITSTHRFPILYTALALATILPNGIGSVLDSAKSEDERKIYEAILDGVAHSNLDIRRKVGLTKSIGQIAEQITGYRDAIVKEGVAIDTIAVDRLLVINSGLRLDLTRDAREKIEHGGVVILMGEREDVAEAYKILVRRLKAIGKLQFERNILAIEMDESQNISIVPARKVIVTKDKGDEFLKLLGEGNSFQDVLNKLFGEDAWIYQGYFEEFVQRTYYGLEEILIRLLEETNRNIESTPIESQWLIKDNIATAVKNLINPVREKFSNGVNGADANWLTRILAWHLLVKLGECEEPSGIVIYSLTDFLESKPATAGEISVLKRLIEDTRGRVFFYTSNGYEPAKGIEFLKERIITTSMKTNGPVVYMVNDLDRKSLGLSDLKFGELVDNKLLIPLSGRRDPCKDIFLGLEIIRNNGNITELPSIFEKMLKDMIEEYLVQQGKAPTPEKIRTIYEAEPLPKQIEDSYDEIRELITSV